ncbi:MAG: DUF5715 family protein [Bacteroidales bacterium]|jgi:hypothetical protein|nr:DUF5715 family protein [Bacteroidales bacterium]
MHFLIKKKLFLFAVLFFAAFIILVSVLQKNGQKRDEYASENKSEIVDISKKKNRTLDYNTALKDNNELHLKYALQNGLKKTYESNKEFLAEVDSLRHKGELVYISHKKDYIIDSLTHSHPYLTRQARDLLTEIGVRFNKKQIEKGLKPHKIMVTSLLRTEGSQKSLSRGNANATQQTTSHLYGTTFDISNKKFVQKDFMGNEKYHSIRKYHNLLEEVLKELRHEGRCVVVKELRQACYHITVVE